MDSGRNVTYAYDALGRLSTAATAGSTNYPAWGLSWTYDRYTNRTAQTVTAGTAPSNSVAVDTSSNWISTTGYSYDSNGNMTNDGQNTLVYDAVNRLTSSSGSLGSGTYAYQGSGHRVVKTSAGTTTVYVFSGKRPIAEYTNGTLTKEYIYLGNRLIATYSGGTLNYHHPDNLSERVTTDGSGNKAGEQDHYPYGEDWYLTSTTTKWRLTSYERDAESANDYAVHRYNANRLGRFLSTDPVLHICGDPQMFNRYTYVHGDPINRRDFRGLTEDDGMMDAIFQDAGGGGGGGTDSGGGDLVGDSPGGGPGSGGDLGALGSGNNGGLPIAPGSFDAGLGSNGLGGIGTDPISSGSFDPGSFGLFGDGWDPFGDLLGDGSKPQCPDCKHEAWQAFFVCWGALGGGAIIVGEACVEACTASLADPEVYAACVAACLGVTEAVVEKSAFGCGAFAASVYFLCRWSRPSGCP